MKSRAFVQFPLFSIKPTSRCDYFNSVQRSVNKVTQHVSAMRVCAIAARKRTFFHFVRLKLKCRNSLVKGQQRCQCWLFVFLRSKRSRARAWRNNSETHIVGVCVRSVPVAMATAGCCPGWRGWRSSRSRRRSPCCQSSEDRIQTRSVHLVYLTCPSAPPAPTGIPQTLLSEDA